jgi:hypothetical protein
MEGTDTKLQRSVVEQFTKKPALHHEPDEEEAMDAFREARAKSRESLMLDVRFTDGTIESFDYASLRRMKYYPDGKLMLRFGRDEVRAEGKNLERLRSAISEHRARFIQEGTEGEEGLKPEDAAHIERIVITEGDEEL